MRSFKFITLAALSFSLTLASCGNNEDKKTSETDSTNATTTTSTPAPLPDLIAVRHKVADFNKWKAGYESGDSMRTAAGLHNYLITRGVEDSNTVMVVLRMDDTAKAKQLLADPRLKTAMQKSGVTGKPEVNMVHVEWMDTTTNNALVRVLVTHKVKDRATWRQAFDAHKQARNDGGLTERLIAYSTDDPNTVSVAFVVNDMAKAKTFMASKELKDHMTQAGVEGKPTVFMYTVVQKY